LFFYEKISTKREINTEFDNECAPRSKIPTTGSHRNLQGRCRKVTVSCKKTLEKLPQVSVRNTACTKSPELPGTGRFRAGLFDLGTYIYIYMVGIFLVKTMMIDSL
jgi:hypothetical protein